MVTACLVIGEIFPIAFFASIGRGYLLPMGIALLGLVLTNIIIYAGWGSFCPWAIAALYAGLAGQREVNLAPVSYLIVIITGLAGIVGTCLWWKFADQAR